ncbi:VOC family protein [Zobellia uliginosa]|uniref:VOC family protein n=1 Tax=Zobellia uliginosa TaxID=143224 RepID=UPI001C06723A|nr:VOC family protein [Zobellia uliginosa]MBU2948734.1 VOC family protein [Zobellia uliginosa]
MKSIKTTNRLLDHIVYTVQDLEAATLTLEKKLGVKAVFGGYHPTQGTKNALINLDNGTYLELLAADDLNMNILTPRWMGIDILTKDQITRWALKSEQLEKDAEIVKQYLPEMGNITGGSRNTANGSLLKWQLILPLAKPEVELMPFMVDWSQTETHPHDALPHMDCKLIELYGTHPDPDLLRVTFKNLGINLRIESNKNISLKAIIQCPNGVVEI